MARPEITRRGVLKGALGLSAAGAASVLGFGFYCAGREDAVVAGTGSGAGLLALALRDPAGARQVGTRYLARFPGEADAEWLSARISEAADLAPVRCPATARAALTAAAREDFRTGRTVQIDGWVMGRTELRLCAWLAAGGEGVG